MKHHRLTFFVNWPSFSSSEQVSLNWAFWNGAASFVSHETNQSSKTKMQSDRQTDRRPFNSLFSRTTLASQHHKN